MTKLFNRLPSPRGGIIGHRGMAARAPENTLIGFRTAAQFGLNWVEFDCQPCASGEWVVFHDETLDRTTNGQGIVKNTAYEILKTLDAGTWFHPQFKNEHIPTLHETLSYLPDLGLHPNIEVKVFGEDHTVETMVDFLRILQAAWPNTLPPPLVSSFDLGSLRILRSLDHTLPLGYIIEHPTENSLDLILQEHFDSLHCHYRNISLALLAKANSKSNAIPILVYTVNNQDRLKTLVQNGIAAVFSDITDAFGL